VLLPALETEAETGTWAVVVVVVVVVLALPRTKVTSNVKLPCSRSL
jgi:hypothetical protein